MGKIRLHEAARKKKVAPAPEPPAPPAPLDPAVQKVLQKYGIVGQDGAWRQCEGGLLVAGDDGKPLGEGPLLNPEVVKKFSDLAGKDTRVLDWCLFSAGGGKRAQQETETMLEDIKAAKVREMTKTDQWIDSTGKRRPRVTPEEAEQIWATTDRPVFRNALWPADQDLMKDNDNKLFGYWRNWPGPNDRYERVHKAVTQFLTLTAKNNGVSKVSVYNQSNERRAVTNMEKEILAQRMFNGRAFNSLQPEQKDEVNAALTKLSPEERAAAREKAKGTWTALNSDIGKFAGLDEMEKWNHQVFIHFKRSEVEKDVRYVVKHPQSQPEKPEYTDRPGNETPVYENDVFRVVIPANIMSAIKMGDRLRWGNRRHGDTRWCITTPGQLDTAFAHGAGRDTHVHWNSYNEEGPFAFIIAKRDLGDKELDQIAVHYARGRGGHGHGGRYFNMASNIEESEDQVLARAARCEVQREMAEAIRAADDAMIHGNASKLIKRNVYDAMARQIVKELLD
jgi:hypothetical protein